MESRNSYMQLDTCLGLLEEATQDVPLLQKLSFQKWFLQIWSTKFVNNKLTGETEALGWIHRNHSSSQLGWSQVIEMALILQVESTGQSECPHGKGPFAAQRCWKYCLWLQVSSRTNSNDLHLGKRSFLSLRSSLICVPSSLPKSLSTSGHSSQLHLAVLLHANLQNEW